jgi:hypothetical protein
MSTRSIRCHGQNWSGEQKENCNTEVSVSHERRLKWVTSAMQPLPVGPIAAFAVPWEPQFTWQLHP